MTTWRDLELSFGQMETALAELRIDYQWDDDLTHEQIFLAGGASRANARKFAALATLAGKLMQTMPSDALPERVRIESDPTARWYKALWYIGGPHEAPMVARLSSDGKFHGHLFVGHIRHPAIVSVAVALHLQALTLDPFQEPQGLTQPSRFGRVIAWLDAERRDRGAFWTLVAFLVTVAIAILAL